MIHPASPLADWAAFAAQIWPQVFTVDLARYLIGAGGVYLLVNRLGARWLARVKIRAGIPPLRQIGREILASLRTVAIFATVGAFLVTGAQIGLYRIEADPFGLGWPYLAGSTLALIVLHDAWFYWSHRLLHHRRLFRIAHRLHHRSHQPTPWTAYAFDTTEAAANGLFLPVTLLALPVSPLALFLFTGHMMLRNALGHCGYELFPARADGRPLFGWLTTVTHHDLHHAQGRWNFGLYFTFWDRVMGTEHPEYLTRFAAAVGRSRQEAQEIEAAVEAAAEGAPRSRRGGRALGLLVVGLAAALALATWERARAGGLEPLAGVWATEGHGAHVRLGACPGAADRLCGWLIWSWDPAALAKAPDGPMLWDFVEEPGGAWTSGRLRHPEDGFVYRGAIRAEGDALRLEGCAAIFCAEQVWRRLDAIPGCAAARGAD